MDPNKDSVNPNDNCLAGMKCPSCGSYGPFKMVVSCIALVTDEGIEETEDYEWDKTSYCACVNCQHDATVFDFTEVI